MLAQLYIENIAVIRKAEILFSRGLNIFTGETGAGKTILISAIDAVLGERTSRDIIRSGEESAVVSALFTELPPHIKDKLAALGYEDDDGTVLITRELNVSGKTSCKVGGRPATTTILRDIASLMIHIHGQRDSTQLLMPERHTELIDDFGELQEDRERYQSSYTTMKALTEELEALSLDDAQKAQRIDMLTFQIKEIEDAALEDADEEDDLLARRKVIRNSEKIANALSKSSAAFDGWDDETDGITALLDILAAEINTVAAFDEEFQPMSERLCEIQYELADFSGEIRGYIDNMLFDANELNQVESRLDVISKLKRKYGGSIPEILEFFQNAQAQLESITSSEERQQETQEKLGYYTALSGELAGALSEKRAAAAEIFMRQVEQELASLNMPQVRLSISRTPRPLYLGGNEDMQFLIITNVGEAMKPLSKIASGGEIARIMLAIKNVLAERDKLDTLVFDEVDTGVSGSAAQKIGQKLRQVSRSRQVICVTHLAGVAACADTHLQISKQVIGDRTFTLVSTLDDEQKIAELARITSGDIITEISLQNARELREYSLSCE